jgi:hypothetical protein
MMAVKAKRRQFSHNHKFSDYMNPMNPVKKPKCTGPRRPNQSSDQTREERMG